MSQGIEHIKASSGLATGFLVSSGAFLLSVPFFGYIGLYIGAAMSILLTPDQDIDGYNISDKIIKKLFITDYVWRTFWKPYALSFKHRSPYSHGILISTIIRWVYLFCPLIVQVLNDQQRVSLGSTILAQSVAFFHISAIIGLYLLLGDMFWSIMLSVFIGNLTGDILHWLMDINWRFLR